MWALARSLSSHAAHAWQKNSIYGTAATYWCHSREKRDEIVFSLKSSIYERDEKNVVFS